MRRIKSFSFIVILLVYGLTAVAWAQPLYENKVTNKHSEFKRTNKVTRNLIVNSSKDYRTITYKCDRQGVRDIINLMEKSKLEEFWAYLPQKCQWIEIGRDENSEDGGATIRIDRKYLSQLMTQHLEIDIYHFHPKYYFNLSNCNDLVGSFSKLSNSQKEFCFRLSMPGPEDIYLMMDTTWVYKQKNPSFKMTHKVISPNGIVEYVLTKEGEKRYAVDRNLRTGGLYLKLVASNSLSEGIEYLASSNSLKESAVFWLANKLSGKYHKVTFFTFDEYFANKIPVNN